MVCGGKREGAGRPAKEPTTTVRVPTATAGAAKQLAETALAVAKAVMKERHPSVDLTVEVLEVVVKRATNMLGHDHFFYEGPMMRCSATDGTVREEFFVSLCGAWFIG